MTKVLKNISECNFTHNIEVLGVSTTAIVTAFVYSFPQYQETQWNRTPEHNLNLKHEQVTMTKQSSIPDKV